MFEPDDIVFYVNTQALESSPWDAIIEATVRARFDSQFFDNEYDYAIDYDFQREVVWSKHIFGTYDEAKDYMLMLMQSRINHIQEAIGELNEQSTYSEYCGFPYQGLKSLDIRREVEAYKSKDS